MSKRKAAKQVPSKAPDQATEPLSDGGRPPSVLPSDTDPTGRRLAFAQAFVLCGNASEAYRRAGYKDSPHAGDSASRLLARPDVKAYIARAEAATTKDVLSDLQRHKRRLDAIAHADIRKLYRPDGSLKPPHEWDDATAAAVISIEIEDLFEGSGKDRAQVGHTKKVKIIEPVRPLLELLKREEDAAKAPSEPTPGSSPETPLYVKNEHAIDPAAFRAFADDLARAGLLESQGALPEDGGGKPLDPQHAPRKAAAIPPAQQHP